MKIINKAQCALVPLVMACSIVNAASLEDQIKKIDEKTLQATEELAKKSSNTSIQALVTEAIKLNKNYTAEGAYTFYEKLDEALTKCNVAQVDKITKKLIKKEGQVLKEEIEKEKSIMDAGVYPETGQEYNKLAKKMNGVIDTGGNKTTNIRRKTGDAIKESIMEADTANSPTGLKYIKEKIQITTDTTVTPELLAELKKENMDITEENMTALEQEIKGLTLNKSDALIDIITEGIHSKQINNLKAALKSLTKSLNPTETAEKNIEDLIGKDEYSKYKGVRRSDTQKKKLGKLYAQYKKVTNEGLDVNDTLYDTEEDAGQAHEMYNEAVVTKLLNKAEQNVDKLKEDTDEITKLKDKIKEYEKKEAEQQATIKDSLDDIKKIYGIDTTGVTEIGELMDLVCLADIETIAANNGYVKGKGEGDKKLLDRITDLEKENQKLKAKITSLESGGDKEIALEDKQFIKWMRDRLDVKDRKEVNDRWPWMLDKSISAINVPKKGA